MHKIPREQRNVAGGEIQQGTFGLLSLESHPGDAEDPGRDILWEGKYINKCATSPMVSEQFREVVWCPLSPLFLQGQQGQHEAGPAQPRDGTGGRTGLRLCC